MSQSHTRQQVVQHLTQHGPIEDPAGRATAKLRQALDYQGSEASFTQLIANMDRAGQLSREVKGKRTYRIVPVDSSPSDVHNKPARMQQTNVDMDYDTLASALLVQVAQTLSQGNRGRETDGSWARRRIERLERRINDLERALSQAKAESKTLSAERDELRLQLEHSEGNLALLTDRLSTGKPRDDQLSKLLRTDERALLHQLRSSLVNERPDRAS
jgi:uncharacterized protein YicC (UPF0701 family)